MQKHLDRLWTYVIHVFLKDYVRTKQEVAWLEVDLIEHTQKVPNTF